MERRPIRCCLANSRCMLQMNQNAEGIMRRRGPLVSSLTSDWAPDHDVDGLCKGSRIGIVGWEGRRDAHRSNLKHRESNDSEHSRYAIPSKRRAVSSVLACPERMYVLAITGRASDMRGNGEASVSCSLNYWGCKSDILGWHVKRVDMLLCCSGF